MARLSEPDLDPRWREAVRRGLLSEEAVSPEAKKLVTRGHTLPRPKLDDLLTPLLASRSVAVYGLLGDIACNRFDLLDGLLAPLATSIALIPGDRIYKSRAKATRC